jgi:hypothetical protein
VAGYPPRRALVARAHRQRPGWIPFQLVIRRRRAALNATG